MTVESLFRIAVFARVAYAKASVNEHPPNPPFTRGGKIRPLVISFPPLAKRRAGPPKGWVRRVGSGGVAGVWDSRPKTRRQSALLGLLAGMFLTGAPSRARASEADEATATTGAAVEFFEKKVRPILVERCQGCHGASQAEGRAAARLAAGGPDGRRDRAGGRRPASRKRACWSTRSTTASSTRCRRSRSCPAEEIATLDALGQARGALGSRLEPVRRAIRRPTSQARPADRRWIRQANSRAGPGTGASSRSGKSTRRR